MAQTYEGKRFWSAWTTKLQSNTSSIDTAPTPNLEELASRLDRAEEAFGFLMLAKHILGVNNVISDHASRIPGFAAMWNGNPTRYLVLKQSWVTELAKRCGSEFAVDALADDSGLFPNCPAYCYPSKSAFSQSFDPQDAIYAFPPQCIVRDWLQHVVRAPEKRIESIKARAVVSIVFNNPAAFPRHFQQMYLARVDRIMV